MAKEDASKVSGRIRSDGFTRWNALAGRVGRCSTETFGSGDGSDAGNAGLFCALNFPETKKVCIITKRRADESDSFLAQGGICMLRGEEDYEDYFEDTMRAGHYENNKKTVDLMIRSSNLVIRELIRLGVRFERDESGKLAFTKEGAHSQPRILLLHFSVDTVLQCMF